MNVYTLKLTLTIIIVFLFSTQLFSQTNKIDSLSQEVKNAEGERKLELLFELANFCLDTDEMFNISKQVESEASRQKNMRYLAGSMALKSRHFMLQNNMDSTVYYGELANRIYAENDIKNPNQTYLYIGRIYLFHGYYELAIRNIKTYLENRSSSYSYNDYILLTEAYLALNKYDLAKETIMQAIEQSQKVSLSENEKLNSYSRLMCYYYLILAYTNNKEYEKALETCATVDTLINRDKELLKEPLVSELRIQNYTNYASIYVKLENSIEAKSYLDKISQIDYIESVNPIYPSVNCTWGEYYLLEKDYNMALKYLDPLSRYFKEEHPQRHTYDYITEMRITALEGLGRLREALTLQRDWAHYKDSVNQINFPLQVSQLSKAYELDKVEIERAKDRAELEKSRTINIALAVVLVLLCTIIYIIRRNSKKIKEKNKNLFKQYAELDKYIVRERKFFVESQAIQDSDSKELQLFKRIEVYVNETQIFKNSNLTREELAEHLNTNRGYLTDAIKSETGKTFLEYINHYRLDYARYQLMTNESTPVNQIMYDAGFASSSTFYKLFKERFGMSPNELRQAKVELEED